MSARSAFRPALGHIGKTYSVAHASGTAASVLVTNNFVFQVAIQTVTSCYVAIDQTATSANGMLLSPSIAPIVIDVTPGRAISFVSVTAGGAGFVTELM